MASASTMARTFGHSERQTLAPTSLALGRELPPELVTSRLSSPARAAASSASADMPHHLFVQPVLDLQGAFHRLTGLKAPRALAGHVEFLQHAAGPAAEQ